MPTIKDLERFQRDLITLAREDEVLAQWGEVREPLAPPSSDGAPPPGPETVRQRGAKPPPGREAAMPPDFAELLSKVPGPVAADDGIDRVTGDEELASLLAVSPDEVGPTPSSEDFGAADSGFDETATSVPLDEGSTGSEFDLGTLELGGEEESAPSAEAPSEASSALDDFDLAAFAGLDDEVETGTAAAPETVVEAATEPAVEPIEPSEPAFEEAVPALSEDEFAMPELGSEEFGLGDESFEIPEPAAEPGEEAVEEAVEDAAPEFEESGTALEGDFELPSLGEPEEGPAPAETAEAAGEDFSIPLGFGEEAAPEAEAGTAPTPDGATDFGDLGAFDFSDTGAGGDAFDSFSFGEPPNPALAGDALDRELANLGADSGTATTFNLDSGWEGVGGLEEAPPARPEPSPSGKVKEEKSTRPLALSDAQVDHLQDNLLALPFNLRLAVEDIVANERGTEAQRTDLVWMLVENAAITELAAAAGKVLRRRIAIPEGYVRRTGAGYLAERGSLRYVLIHTVLPIVRTAVLALLVASAVGYLGYRFIWRPVVATQIYREGYQRIQQGRYPEAEDAFARATEIREFVSWYYRYAEAYAAKRLWIYAESKYSDLLRRHPDEKRGALAWAGIERDQLKYRDGIDVLNKYVLDRKNIDPDALLLEGDIYLDWADEDPTKYEDARKRFASLIQFYGAKDLYLERMLLYFMRTGNLAEVQPLKKRFLGMPNDPLSASTLAELGGFLLDHGQLEDVFRTLKAALAKNSLLPETHWQLHRYYRSSGDHEDELKALDNAIAGFERLPALGRRRLSMYLESLIRRGDMGIADGQYIRAESDFGKAVVAYGNALDIGRLKPDPAYARAWAGLADVAYLAKDDLASAEQLYAQAADNGWDNAEIRYRRGFIAYRQGRFADALEHFWIARRDGDQSPFLDWALATGFAQRGDWNAAVSAYKSLVDRVGDLFDALDYPVPQEKLYDRNVTELLMEAQNNLGVAYFRLGDRIGDPRLKAKAVPAFTESARLFDLIVHDARSLVGANATNLGYANLDYMLHPRRGVDLSTYDGIQKDDTWVER